MNHTAHELYEIAKKAGEEEFQSIMRELHSAANKGQTEITIEIKKPIVISMLKNLGIKAEHLPQKNPLMYNYYTIKYG